MVYFRLNGQVSFSFGINYCKFNLVDFNREYRKRYEPLIKYSTSYNFGVECKFPLRKLLLHSGGFLSSRTSNEFNPFFKNRNFRLETVFFEVPFLVSIKPINFPLFFGCGLNGIYRLGTNVVTQNDYKKPYGLDFKCFVDYKFYNRFHSIFSFTYGNVDKLLFDKQEFYLYNLFSFNLAYDFYSWSKK